MDAATRLLMQKELCCKSHKLCEDAMGAPIFYEVAEWVGDKLIPRFRVKEKKKISIRTDIRDAGSTSSSVKKSSASKATKRDRVAEEQNAARREIEAAKIKLEVRDKQEKEEERYEQAKRMLEADKKREEAAERRRIFIRNVKLLRAGDTVKKLIKLIATRKKVAIGLREALERAGISTLAQLFSATPTVIIKAVTRKSSKIDRKSRRRLGKFLEQFILGDTYTVVEAKSLEETSGAGTALLKYEDNGEDNKNEKVEILAAGTTAAKFGKAEETKHNIVTTLIDRMPREWVDARRKESVRLQRDFRRQQTKVGYKKMRKQREKLPSYKLRNEITNLVQHNQVVVISGATGCGKSTQVPQFLLDHSLESGNGGFCNIVCTQPRRIAAIGIAERVASERAEKCGDSVGYSIRLETKRSARTRLLFCTTGILLRTLESDRELKEGPISHIVVDEVHERSLDSDFLLIVLKDLLRRRPGLRLVLMSATLNADLFSEYFEGCKVLDIPGRTFPVTRLFLEDVVESTGYFCPPGSEYAAKLKTTERKVEGGPPVHRSMRGSAGRVLETLQHADPRGIQHVRIKKAIGTEYSANTIDTLATMDMDRINYDLLAALVKQIVVQRHSEAKKIKHKEEKKGGPPIDGAILIFLTGFNEIKTLLEALRKDRELADESRFWLVPLHSALSSEDQRRVFKIPGPGITKIVLSTNIAETSVTINDCTVVIDCGKMKETQYDSQNGMSCLVETAVSRANASQRAGRAGRVREGIAYHLFPSYHQETMLAQPIPEMHRAPLEALCLRIKILRLGDIHKFLARALEPPPSGAIEHAIKVLQTLNALSSPEKSKDNKVEVARGGELTPLGYHLARLPVDARIAKMMIYGCVFRCVEPCLTIAASMAFRSPFMAPFDKREEADKVRRHISNGNISDHLTLLAAYDGWIDIQRTSGASAARQYLRKNFLSYNTLSMIRNMKEQFKKLLANIGFLPQIRSATLRSLGKVSKTSSSSSRPRIFWEERRIDSSDGKPYTEASFVDVYGGLTEWKLSKPGPPLERRVDPSDGNAYTKHSFLETYGGLKEWEASGKAAAAAMRAKGKNVVRDYETSEAERSINENQGNLRLVRALLVAGLYPNVVRVDRVDVKKSGYNDRKGGKGDKKVEVKLTANTGSVEIHPASVLWGEAGFRYPFLIYHEKVKTSKVYLRDATMITPYSLLLFGGNIKVDHTMGQVVVDDWISFNIPAQHAVLIHQLRLQIDKLLQRKITEPQYDALNCDQSNKIVEAVSQLMLSEE